MGYILAGLCGEGGGYASLTTAIYLMAARGLGIEGQHQGRSGCCAFMSSSSRREAHEDWLQDKPT
jgi:hypothetical protein